ncbi:MAG: aldo/keto reductase [Candidatus Aenigmatarchaeota archaeon]
MIYNKINGQKISQIAAGGGVLNPNKDPDLTLEETKGVLKYQVENGVNLIDTGKEYDEEFLGQAFDGLIEDVFVASKSEAPDRGSMKSDFEDSLDKLGKETLFIYQMHMVNSIEDLTMRLENGVLDVLTELKRKGKIDNIGIFSHRIDVLEEAAKTNAFDIVSTLYNTGHRLAEKLFPLLEKYNTKFIAVAPFSNGILVDPKFDEERHIPQLNPENALKFLFSSKYVSTVFTGSRTLAEARENVDVAKKKWEINGKERDEIEELVKEKLGNNFCRGCRYCEPCEEWDDLIISEILKLRMYYEKFGYKDFAKWQYSMMPQSKNKKRCTECGKCLEKCPYNIDIMEKLKKAYKLLSS